MAGMAAEEFEQVIQQTRELVGAFREVPDRLAVSENEFWIWYSLIVLGGDQTQQDICAAWSLRKQTVNTIVSAMVKKGYAALEPLAGTRSCKRICLTEAGRAYGESLILPMFQAEKRAFFRLPPQDRQVFQRIMGEYIRLLRQEMRERE